MIETYPSESGRFYYRDGRPCETIIGTNGNSRKPTARDAAKLNIVPSVTTITKVAHKEAIQRWMVNRAIKFTASALRENHPLDEWGGFQVSDDDLASEVWQLLNADSDAITGRGKELHAAIEQCAQGKDWSGKWDEHIHNLYLALRSRSIPMTLGNTEHSFATSRYGGKIDWHNDEWLLDFKTKPRIEDGKKLAYPEHAQQLAAYAWGLFPFKQYSEKAFMFSDNKRRCANVFIGVEDAEVVFHEWSEKDLLKGWRKFEALLNVWWCDYEH